MSQSWVTSPYGRWLCEVEGVVTFHSAYCYNYGLKMRYYAWNSKHKIMSKSFRWSGGLKGYSWRIAYSMPFLEASPDLGLPAAESSLQSFQVISAWLVNKEPGWPCPSQLQGMLLAQCLSLESPNLQPDLMGVGLNLVSSSLAPLTLDK